MRLNLTEPCRLIVLLLLLLLFIINSLHQLNQFPILSTALNRALPLIICSKASVTCSSGKTSVIGLTSERTLNDRVSCESIDVPPGQPINDRRPDMKRA